MQSLFIDARLDFSTPEAARKSEDVLLRILGIMAMLSLFELRQHPELPRLYESGVRYVPPDQAAGSWVEKSKIPKIVKCLTECGMKPDKVAIIVRLIEGAEIFQDILTLFEAGKGDCDRLVVARLAELWNAGLMASPYLIPYPNESGGKTYHAVIDHADGSIEDPSAILGMPVPPGTKENEIAKNMTRHERLLAEQATRMVADGMSPQALGARIDAAGFMPRGGYR